MGGVIKGVTQPLVNVAKSAGNVFSQITQPNALNDPRQGATNTFGSLFSGGLKGSGIDLGSLLSGLGSLPGFGGNLTAQNPLQDQAMRAGSQSLASFLSGDQGASILGNLQGIAGGGQDLNLPPEIQALFGGANGGPLSEVAGGSNSLMEQIQRMVQGNPNAGILSALSGQGNGAQGATDQISQLLSGFSNPGLSSLQGMNYGNSFLSQLGDAKFASPEQTMLQQLAASGNNPFIQQLAGRTPGISQLLRLGSSGGDTSAQSTIQSLLGSDAASSLLGGGQGQDLNSIAAALQGAAQPGIDRGLRDLREQFSFNGLRNSTDLNAAAGDYLNNAQSQLTGQLAQIAPQLAATRSQTSLGALQALISGAGTQGQLGQGTLAQQIQALTSGAGLSQSGVQGAANAQNTQLGTLGQILGQAGQLGQGSQSLNLQSLLGGANSLNSLLGLQQQGTTSAAGLNLDTLKAMLGGAGQSGQLALGGQQNVLQALLGAGGLNQQGQQLDLNSLQQLLGTQAGAAQALGSQQTQQGGILASLFGGQQGNALQAALGLPGAFSSISQLPGLLAGSVNNLGHSAFQDQNANIQNQFASFLQQQSLLPQLMSFLSGTGAQQYGPSIFDNLNKAAQSGISAGAVAAAK